MSALSPCCQAEEEEKCNCNRLVVSARDQLSNINMGKKCNCMMMSADSSFSKMAKTDIIIEAHASASNHRPQNVGRANWDELDLERQQKRNPKTGLFCSHHLELGFPLSRDFQGL